VRTPQWNKCSAGEGTVKGGVSERVDYRLGDGWAESSLTDWREARDGRWSGCRLPHSTKAAAVASLELINEVLSVGDELAARFCQLILAQMIIVEHDRTF